MRHVPPPIPPKNTPRALYEAVRRLSESGQTNSQGLAAIGRGGAPDSGGISVISTSSHSALLNLAWTMSGHTGSPSTFAGFNAGGVADETVKSSVPLLSSANIFTTTQTLTPDTDVPGLIVNGNSGATAALINIKAAGGNTIFSVGADGVSAGKGCRFGRTGVATWWELMGGTSPSFKNSSGTNLLAITAQAGWFSDSVSAEGLWIGESHSGNHNVYLLGINGSTLTRLAIGSVYSIFTTEISTAVPIPTAWNEMMRLHIHTSVGGDTKAGLLIDTTSATHTADLFKIDSAVSGAQTFIVDNKVTLQATIKSSSFIVDQTTLTKKVAFDLSGTAVGTSTLSIGNTAARIYTFADDTSTLVGRVSTSDIPGQSAAFTDTILYTTIHAGFYRVSAYVVLTAVTLGGTLTVDVTWTDPQGTTTDQTFVTKVYTTAGEQGSGSLEIYCTAASDLKWRTTFTGTGTYNVYGRVEAI